MDDFLKHAVELARAQASVRVMTEEEITAFVARMANNLRAMAAGEDFAENAYTVAAENLKKCIKEKSVTCLECGKSFKLLSKKHLAQHGLTPEEYRTKYGLQEGTPLVCKTLQRDRRKKMMEMQLWERRRKPATQKE
ncbi:MAG: MucR family transcriptional regulator [Desulfovibrio sp.]|nr:MucR family transcriptional regulator [Desulfovibrio sp.]